MDTDRFIFHVNTDDIYNRHLQRQRKMLKQGLTLQIFN